MLITHIKLLLTAIFWGGTFIAGRIVAQNVPPFSAAFLRFLIATVILLAVTWRMEPRFPRLTARQACVIVLLGMTGVFFYNFFFFLGLKNIDAGRASLIIALNPVMICAGAAIFFRENITPLKILGIIVSVSGALVVISRGNLLHIFQGGIGMGELYIFGCVLSWVSFSLIGKLILGALSPLVSITYSSLAGMLALLIPASMEGMWGQLAGYRVIDWTGLLYLGFCGTVLGFVWYYEGIQKIGSTRAGLYINFVPVSAVIMAWLMLNEPVTLSLLVGAGMVSTGVYMTSLKQEPTGS
ncbi:MAG: DMT family transporter [Desulfatirhabdiaceae bacterium]